MELISQFGLFGSNALQLTGLAGVAFYLGSYAALQTGIIGSNGYGYAGANLIASGLVLVSLFQDYNLSSAIIQVSWIIISSIGLLRLYYLRNMVRFNERERALVHSKLYNLPSDLSRNLLQSGEWHDVEAGRILIAEDEPITELHFLLEGSADVICGGKKIAAVEAGAFLGEVTCFNGGKATATAIIDKPGTMFSINVEKLRTLAPSGTPLRHAFEVAIAEDLRRKISKRPPENRPPNTESNHRKRQGRNIGKKPAGYIQNLEPTPTA